MYILIIKPNKFINISQNIKKNRNDINDYICENTKSLNKNIYIRNLPSRLSIKIWKRKNWML